MRKLVASFFVSLDGVVEAPGPQSDFEFAGWTMPYWSDEIEAFIDTAINATDAMLLGRVTYTIFQSAFGSTTEGNDDATTMNGKPKYVVSTTLKEATWHKSTLIKDNVVEEVLKLKGQPGKDIGMSGSVDLVNFLLQHNLIDELNMLVYPVVLGRGKRLFADGTNLTLNLVQTKSFSSGVVALTYQPAL